MSSFFLIISLISMSALPALAQSYDTIPVGFSTSVNLIFDSPVKKWDMGLGVRVENGQEIWDILVENPTDSPNRIKLAAGIEHFETTNLFVETENAYYNFILVFNAKPQYLLYKLGLDKASIRKSMQKNLEDSTANKKSTTPDKLQIICQEISLLKDGITGIGEVSQKMLFYLGGIYVSGDHLFFRIHAKNEGSLAFDLGFVGFFTGNRSKKGSKRKPRQEETLSPTYIYNEKLQNIKTNESLLRVYVFEKFTLSRDKKLYIQFWEGDRGERKVELEVKSKDILLAKKI